MKPPSVRIKPPVARIESADYALTPNTRGRRKLDWLAAALNDGIHPGDLKDGTCSTGVPTGVRPAPTQAMSPDGIPSASSRSNELV
jgi:hypothetical protein